MMKMFPVMAALDANKDGVISSEEIDGAVIALKKLDKDKNGKLEGPELMPDMAAMMRGRGGAGGFGGFGGGEGRPRRPGEDGPGAGRGGEGQGGRGGQRGPDVAAFVDRMFGPDGIDENKDKKISKDEVPDRMKEMFASADADKDGFMSRAEVEAFLKARAQRAGGRSRGGEAGGRGRGGEGGRTRGGGGAEGDRPRRPQRPAVEDDK